jgi:NADH dehydrogenase
MTTLVAGGTGRLGSMLVERLREAGGVVRVLTRSEASAGALRGAGVEAVVGRAEDPRAAAAAATGCSAVVASISGFAGTAASSVRTVDGAGNLELIRAASTAGVRRFVLVSSLTAAPRARLELDRSKDAAERALRSTDLDWTIVRAAPFLETQLAVMGESLPATGRTTIYGSAEAEVRVVPLEDVAAAVLQAASGARGGGVIELPGAATSLQAMSEALHRAAGTDGRSRRIPIGALRLMAVTARPFAPFLARAAGAAVVLHDSGSKPARGGAVARMPAPVLDAAARASLTPAALARP